MDVKVPLLCSAVLLLTHFSRGQYQLVAPSEPLIAPVGSTAVLPCQLDPVKDFGDMALEWARPDLSPRYVHIRRDGVNLLTDQNPLYVGRTSLNERKLKHGDMSLQLSRVKLSDNGTYRCYVPQMDTSAHVQLLVVSMSCPSVSLTKGPGGSPVLQCSSGRWYPEPELQWLDSEGTVVSGGAPQTHVTEDLFTVSSRVTVEQSRGSTFTCRVSESSSKQSRESHITITDEFMEVPSCSVPWTLFSLGLLLLLIPVAYFVWKFKFSKSKKAKTEIEDTRVEKQELLEKSEEKRLDLNQTQNREIKFSEKFKYSEDLRRIEDELQYFKDLIEKQAETITFQTSLKEKLSTTIHQLKDHIKEEEEEKKKAKVFKEKYRKHIREMEKLLSEFENIFEKTTKELEQNKKIFDKTHERKDRLERDKQELMKKLEEKNSVEVKDEVKVEDDVETSPEQKKEAEPEEIKEQDSTDAAVDDLTDVFGDMKINNK